MARGSARTPSQHAYRGALGRTTTATVHVAGPRGELIAAQVYTTIDAVSDPELVDRLHADDPARALNVVRIDGVEPIRVAVPVLYHDPAAELLVLVLDAAHRHRELAERVAVYEALRADDVAIPTYAKEFAVVYGAAGLRAYLERRAQDALEAARAREVERRAAELDVQRAELASARAELARGRAELEHARAELDVQRAELASARAEVERLRSEARNRVIASAQQAETTVIAPPPAHAEAPSEPRPAPRAVADDVAAAIDATTATPRADTSDSFEVITGVIGAPDVSKLQVAASAVEADDEITDSAAIPAGADPLTTETADADAPADAWSERAAAQPSSTIDVVDGVVRLALVAGDQLARGLVGPLDVRVVLHRTPSYPVIALVVGPPAALRAPHPTQLALITLDIASDHDRPVVAALARKFELALELITRGQRARRVRLTAPLAENVAFVIRAAEDHLRGVEAEGDGVASFARAVELVRGAGFDVVGASHPEAGEFRDDKLAQLDTAQHVRRALAIARRFARPSREDYLVCTRGYPLARWRAVRRAVLERAVGWGLWMGPELAQVAVSEGLARSRRDLIGKLAHGFDALKRQATAFDLDGDAADDNAKALAEEARALGVEIATQRNGTGAIASDAVSSVSGSIGGSSPRGSVKPRTIDELIALLDDRGQRVAAALELCERADPRAAAPVIASVHTMSRAEAVRVLGLAVKFGDAAKPPLLEGLASSKAFLRHGCALALALLRTEDGTQAVIDLLLAEPTEIWREVARAIGQVGPTALLPLASTYGRLGERANETTAERVAWAMAHVAVRGGKAAVETMAGGQSVVAPVARRALELHGSAASDHVRVRPGADGSQPGRDVTVNRAFSRRFFEALEQGLPEIGHAGLVDLDASQPMEMLDEADLIEDDEAELDETDLIQ